MPVEWGRDLVDDAFDAQCRMIAEDAFNFKGSVQFFRMNDSFCLSLVTRGPDCFSKLVGFRYTACAASSPMR